MEIDLSGVELAPDGIWPGKIVAVTEGEEKTRKGLPVKTVNLDIQLELKQSDGSQFELRKVMRQNTKGRQKLFSMLKNWHPGTTLTKEVLAKFNPQAEFEGKTCSAHIDRVSENGKQVAKVGEVMPK